MSVSTWTAPPVSVDGAEVEKLRRAYLRARQALLSEQLPGGYWVGQLSASALATATAVSALSLVSPERFASYIASGVCWLEADQNPDGGWGDTPTSPSNLPTTMLVRAAFQLAPRAGVSVDSESASRAEDYIGTHAGKTPGERVAALQALYGKDRTFATPILTNCALAAEFGVGGPVPIEWARVPGLPFELACVPRSWFRFLRLHVVSYALPALIAIGQVIHSRHPTRNPLLRVFRGLAVTSSLRRLQAIQPQSGGYLEAVPLTSFVTMSLAAMGLAEHPVARKAVEFLCRAARPDGSWPIDSNLSTWVTTQSLSALSRAGGLELVDRRATENWLIGRQYTTVHPYTGSPPGGWGWTHLPGGVPDADDTSGALLALAHLEGEGAGPAARAGLNWLLNLQNADGGWPSFCRGWGKLPFDRSAPDLTAHALRALSAWSGTLRVPAIPRAIDRGFGYLSRKQRADGAWVPLWFGNQQAPEQENPVYGTSRVLLAYPVAGARDAAEALAGLRYLIRVQNDDGGWGGAAGVSSSTEESALVVEALSEWLDDPAVRGACLRGCRYLADRVDDGGLDESVPIGLYFAKLWYAERLYPMIWTVGALGAVLTRLARGATAGSRSADPEQVIENE